MSLTEEEKCDAHIAAKSPVWRAPEHAPPVESGSETVAAFVIAFSMAKVTIGPELRRRLVRKACTLRAKFAD